MRYTVFICPKFLLIICRAVTIQVVNADALPFGELHLILLAFFNATVHDVAGAYDVDSARATYPLTDLIEHVDAGVVWFR